MNRGLFRASVTVTALSLAGLAASFCIQLFLAARFGAATSTDAYLAAVTIPTVLNTVFLTALSVAFVPVFVQYDAGGSREAWRVANGFSVVVLLVLGLFVLAGTALSATLVRWVAPGLAGHPQALALASSLQWILLPAMLPAAWSALLASLFYARQSFVIPSLGPLLASLVTLLVAWAFANSAGIHAVAAGVLAGHMAQALFLWLCLIYRFRPPLTFTIAHPGVRQIGRLMLPWLLGAIIYKGNPVVDRVIASQFPAGAISMLGYALMLAQVAVFVCSKGASQAVFPAMARLASAGERGQFPAVIDTGLRLVLAAVVPAVVLIALLAEPLVAAALQRGVFTAADSRGTAHALLAYTGAIVALALGNILTYAFYALQDTRTPAVIGVMGMALNIALALTLRGSVGFLAPALSFSAMCLFNLVVLAAVLRRRMGRLVLPRFAAFSLRTALAGLLMAVGILAARASQAALPAAWAVPMVALIYPALAGVSVYALLLGLAHRAQLRRMVRRFAHRAAA